MVADDEDDQKYRRIKIAEEGIADRFEGNARVREHQKSEQNGESRNEHDEHDVRRIVSALRHFARRGEIDFKIFDINDVHDDIRQQDKRRKGHHDDFLRAVQFIPEGTDHLVSADHVKNQDQTVEKQGVYKDFQAEKSDENQKIHGTRNHS